MSNAKHTPAPWKYDGDGFDSVAARHCGTDGYTVFPVDENGDVTGCICEIADCIDDDEAEANARLIAAAPELLAFIESIAPEGFSMERGLTFDQWTDARKLIAEATGGDHV
jgi:hypothetical protein